MTNIRKKAADEANQALKSSERITQQIKEKASESHKTTMEAWQDLSNKVSSLKEDLPFGEKKEEKVAEQKQITNQEKNEEGKK